MTTNYDREYVEKRFPMMTLTEARQRAKETETWVFEGLILSSITLIYGRSNVGKSYLITSLLLALMLEDREFLGLRPTEAHKVWKPAILYTDPGSAEEYGDRFDKGAPYEELDVPLFRMSVTRSAEEWEALTDHLIAIGRNFVVLDNLIGVTGDPNDALAASIVFDGLNRLVAHGIPVVVLHHETEKGRTVVGAGPIGVGEPVRRSRAWIQVRQTARKRFRGGNTALYVQGNALDRHYDVVAEPLSGPDFKVISWNPVEDTEKSAPKDRAPETLDARIMGAAWIVEHCQGLNITEAAKAFGEHTGRDPENVRNDIKGGGRWKDILTREGTTWSLVK